MDAFDERDAGRTARQPWNKGKLIGQKPPLRPKHVWSIRTKLHMEGRLRDLAMFNLAIDSKLARSRRRRAPGRGRRAERVRGRSRDSSAEEDAAAGQVRAYRADAASGRRIHSPIRKKPGEFLFCSRGQTDRCMTTRQYARLVASWVESIALDPRFFATHSLCRTKPTLIYRRTGNLRAVQLLLGHRKIESTVRYLGIEVDDALAIAEQVEV